MSAKDYTQRPQVIKYLPIWQKFLADNGPDMTRRFLEKGWTTRLKIKDRRGIIQALKL